MDLKKKVIITREKLRKDVYDNKKVWTCTALACAGIYIVFNTDNIWLLLIGSAIILGSIRSMNKQTLKGCLIDEDKFFIACTIKTKEMIEIQFKEGKFCIDPKSLPMIDDGEKFYLIFVNNAPTYAYSSTNYCLSPDLLSKVVITRNAINQMKKENENKF